MLIWNEKELNFENFKSMVNNKIIKILLSSNELMGN